MAGRFILNTRSLEEITHIHRNGQPRQDSRALLTKPVPILSAGQMLPACQRLIVLVPNSAINQNGRFPQRIWQFASPGEVSVLYLAIAGDFESEMTARRQLTLLAAITQDKRVKAEIQVAHTSSWLEALFSIARPGDLILSHSGQMVKKGLFGSETLGDQLGRCLDVPVYVLAGYIQKTRKNTPSILRRVLFGALLGLILAGFFELDAQVIYQLKGPLQQTMLFFLLVIEIGAVWVWNGLTG